MLAPETMSAATKSAAGLVDLKLVDLKPRLNV